MATTLNDLFRNQLRVLYGMEATSKGVFTKMATAATGQGLRAELETHATDAQSHMVRLEEVFNSIDEKPTTKPCKGFGGLTDNCRSAAASAQGGGIRDAVLLATTASLGHNEVAGYDSALGWAKALKHDKAGELLQKTRDEARASSKRLASITSTVTAAALPNAIG